LGFSGSNSDVLARAAKEAAQLLRAVCSASSMWTANAGTMTPSMDVPDSRVHFTPANLQSSFHRYLEPQTTGRVLQAIFRDEQHFAHHPVLPATPAFSDEGAANHTRLCGEYGEPGVHLFVYGRQAFGDVRSGEREPTRFPARQTLEASQAVARQHGLTQEQTVFAQQHPDAIDAGVFHNDVIAVGNGPVLLYHEMAFLDEEGTLNELRAKMASPLIPVRVPLEAVSMEDAVASYLFNSQLLSNPDGTMTLVVPGECQEREAVWNTIQNHLLAGNNPISEVIVKDVKQSMRNGGGPACLRLRVVLKDAERAALTGRVLLTDTLYDDLTAWVNRHYRDRLAPDDLADPKLAEESLTALDELTQLLKIGSVYPFQLG
ncbi:MAG: N-succinylarginine dihydrolase, partial [Gammaproteobacteria bacterium]|nr:N-succinylarginine dihydrolase [Gammaproteobacteria bacterium]